jgi:N-acetylglucosaminyldiphosphoundecaprenol N-acetyl-beta-D-mannosaminyltransferase
MQSTLLPLYSLEKIYGILLGIERKNGGNSVYCISSYIKGDYQLMRTVTIMNIPFLHINQNGFVELLDKRIHDQEKTFVVTANPEIVMKANEDSAFMETIQKATYVVADGIGVVKAAKLLNNPLPGRVTGYDTMIELLKIANEKAYRIYFLGAKKETLEKMIENIQRDYPNVQIAGSHDGYFDWENNQIADEVAALKPDITFVALGVPKQEKWIAEITISLKKDFLWVLAAVLTLLPVPLNGRRKFGKS